MNEQRPTEPSAPEPASNRPDAGWRPPVAPVPDASSTPASTSDEWAFEGRTPDAAASNPQADPASAPDGVDEAATAHQAPAAYPGYDSPYAAQSAPGYPAAGDLTSGYPASGYPTADYPATEAPSYPASGHPTSGAAAGYPTSGSAAGYPTSGPAGGYSTSGAAAAGYPTAGYPATGYPGAPGYPTTGGPYRETQQPAKSGRAGRKVGAGILLLALMVGSGVVGGLVTNHYRGSDGTRVVNGVVVDNAPPIDRSSLAGIASAVRPSVVSITTSAAEGSGVVLSADGYILTNNHVAATAGGKDVDITFSDGSTVKGSLVGTDPKTDLAVFKAEGLSKKLTVAKFGDSSALQVGDTVLAIGSPLGLNGSVTEGIVSALNRTIDETANSQPQDPFSQNQGQSQSQSPTATIAGAIQTDASINPGNSGGALVNMSGEVIGINTAIATSPNGSDGSIGVGFAIPSNRAKEVSQDLIKGVKVSHPYLGIGVVTADGNGGAQVQSVTAGSPAAAAGIQQNDLVTAFDGQPVYTSDDLINAVQASAVGTSVALSVTRGTDKSTINVTLGESK